MFESLLNPPQLVLGPVSSIIINGLVILTISSIVVEKAIDILNIKSKMAKYSSFLLLCFVFSHLIWVEGNSVVESIMIIGVLGLSFIMVVMHKVLFPARKVSA